MRLRSALAAWVAAVSIAVVGVVPAAADSPTDDAPIAYRRVFVPADDVQAWPRDGEKYLPIESRDFDAWVAAGSAAPATVRIARAEYSARLDGDRLVDGHAEWRIEHRGDGPTLLPLGQMAIVVRSPAWRDDPAPVRLGVWQRSDAPPVYGLQVPHVGTLQFAWHSILSHSAQTSLEIPLSLPPSTSKRLVLDLPAGKRPVVEGAVVLETTDVAGPAATDTAAAHQPPQAWRRWTLALEASATTELRIEDQQARPAAAPPSASARERLRYHVSQRGLGVTATVRLSDLATELREVQVTLPRSLQLANASAAGHELTWHVAGRPQDATTRAVVRLAQPASDGPVVLRLSAWAPLVVDRPWTLPTMRIGGTYWTSGSSEVEVDPTLELRAVTPVDYVQTGVRQAAADGAAQSLTFAAYSPSAALTLIVGHRPVDAAARVGRTLQVGDPDVTGKLVSQLEVAHGSIFSLAADLAAGWTIDAVETVPADALGQWYVTNRGRGRTVNVQLARPARPDRSVTVVVTGRLQRAGLLEPLPAETLAMLTWHGMQVDRELLLVHTGEPYDVEAIGRLPAVAAEDLSDNDRTLLATATDGRLFDLAAAAPDAAARLVSKHGAYDADVNLDATFERGQLRQTYRVVCRPHASGIEQLLICASRPLPADTVWTDASSGRRLNAEPLPADVADPIAAPPNGQRWRVRFLRPASGQVEITAQSTVPCSTRREVALLSLPEAAEQQGRVLVRGSGDSLPAIDERGLTPVPLPTSSEGDAAAVCVAYRYDPWRIGAGGHGPAMWIHAGLVGDAPAGIVARHVAVESSYTSGAAATHRVTYELDNPGNTRFQLRMPADAQPDSVWLDGQPVARPVGAGWQETVTVHLPAGERSPVVSVCFHTAGQPLAAGRRLDPPLPDCGVPVLAGLWTVWLPEEFSAIGPDIRPEAGTFDWRARLFGPWAGHAKQETQNQDLTARNAERIGQQLRGWRAWTTSFVATPPASIVVSHPPATAALALSLFLVCTAGGVWLRCRTRCLVGLTAIAAGLCLLLPAAYAPLATGAWLGLMASLVVGIVRRPEVEDSPTVSWMRLSTAGAIVLGLVLLMADRAVADGADKTSGPATSAAEPHIYRVLVPVDKRGHTVGTKVYVSDEFLRRLLPRAADGQSAGGRWLLGETTIQGDLARRGEGAELTAGTWTMAFDLDVLARDTTVWLPLVRGEAQWHALATLDGIPAPLVWDAGGRRASIHVVEPGEYRLMISLEPQARDEERYHRLGLTVPPLRGARFRLTYPPDLSDCRVMGAIADPLAGPASGTFAGELDGSGSLAVSWPSEVSAAGADRGLQIAELRWLSIEPDGVELDVKYVLEGDAERPGSLTVVADRRWELVEGSADAAAVSAGASRTSGQTIHVNLPPTGGNGENPKRTEVSVRFRLRGGMELGRLRLPPLELTSLTPDQCWLAATTDSSLECEAPAGGALAAGQPDTLSVLWGAHTPSAAPQLVLTGAASDESCVLNVRPHVAQSTVDQVLHVAAGLSRLRLQYQADVEPRGIERYGFSLIVPAGMSIDGLSANQAGRDLPLRYARLSDERINVFFQRPAEEPYRLVLLGRLPVDESHRCAVPHVVWASRPTSAVRTLLYREEQVLVEAQGENLAVVPDRPIDLPPMSWNVRHAATYRFSAASAAAAQMAIRPNDVATTGESLTALTSEAGIWQAAVAIHGRVTRGKLGVVRIEAPASWRGPFDVEPPSPAAPRVSPVAGGRQTIAVRLPEPLSEGQSFDFHLSGPLMIADGQPVDVPDIRLLGSEDWHSYLMVPLEVDGHAAAWATSGVESAGLPDDLSSSNAVPTARVFRVATVPFHVSLSPQLAPRPSASVPLVETAALAGPGGGQYAVSRLVLVPQGLNQCVVEMPAPWQLMRASVDGHPALVEPLGDGRWKLQLTSTRLPQAIEIVSRCTEIPGADRYVVRLSRPTLVAADRPIPVELSLWSLAGRRSAAPPTVDGAKLVSGLQYAAWRLERLVSVAETGLPMAVQSPPPDDYNWLQPWAEVLAAARREAESARGDSGRQPASVQLSPSTDDQLATATSRVDAWLDAANDVLSRQLPGGSPAASHSELPPAAPDGGRWTYCVADGGMDHVTIAASSGGVSPGTVRVVGVVVIVGLAVALVWLATVPAAYDLLWRWPHTAGLLLGLAAWACLRPSWLGLMIVAAVLLLVLRPAWPGPTFRADDSTVLQRGPTL